MYIPDHFKEKNSERLAALVEGYPLGMLATVHDGLPFVSHLPFLFERHSGAHGKLIGHMARANPQWHDLAQGKKVLAVFQGPHAYVSPSWYAAPGVPTWNYAVAHLYGVPRLIEDEAQLETIVGKLTAVHEAKYPEPWQANLSGEKRTRLLGMIVGFEIEVTEIQGKFKLSQNRSVEDQQRVIEQLGPSSSPLDIEVAALMVSNLNNSFLKTRNEP